MRERWREGGIEGEMRGMNGWIDRGSRKVEVERDKRGGMEAEDIEGEIERYGWRNG